MNISLPDPLREFVDGQVASGDYGTSSEYVRELIRRDRRRLALRQMFLDALSSDTVAEANADYFAAKRAMASRS
jgi:antitoxin ParD1/3/4